MGVRVRALTVACGLLLVLAYAALALDAQILALGAGLIGGELLVRVAAWMRLQRPSWKADLIWVGPFVGFALGLFLQSLLLGLSSLVAMVLVQLDAAAHNRRE